MLDFFNLPTNQKGFDQQIFYGNSTTAGASWYQWVKPRGINLINIFMLGGGGGGAPSSIGVGYYGGGGGASGNQYNITFMASVLPDVLYFSIGNGGVGGSSPTAGIASYASIYPATTTNYLLGIASGGGAGVAGSTNVSAGTGGVNAAADSITSAPLITLGMSGSYTTASLTGQPGAGGGSSITLPTTGLVVTGGAGGGRSATSSGIAGGVGGVVGPGNLVFPQIPGGIANTSVGTSGGNGIQMPKMLFFYGGAGGGGAPGISATGGTGGLGSYGCGGGGSGGSYTGGSVAQGGPGGSGLVIVTAF